MKNIFKAIIVTILRFEAKLILKKYQPRIIAVTGSVGKTSTKDAIFALLAGSEHVRKSDKSFNSEIGLPLTIIGVPNAWSNPFRWLQNIVDGLLLVLVTTDYPKWLVLEVGADRPGDIKSLALWVTVDIAVITRLPEVPVHVEYFASPEEVVEEKASIINALRPDGTLVVYADDSRVEMLRTRALAKGARVVTFGLSKHADVQGTDSTPLMDTKSPWPTGMQMVVRVGDTNAPVVVRGVLGSHALLSVIAAAAVGKALGMHVEDMVQPLSTYEPPKGRMRLLPGLKGSLIIDDTYNSSPAAVEAALDTLKMIVSPSSERATPSGGITPEQHTLPGRATPSGGITPEQHTLPGRATPSGGITPGRRIAVLGDMLELGRHSVDEHRKVGAYAATRVDLLVTVGFRARDIAQGALDAGMPDGSILQYEDAAKAGEELQTMVGVNDRILVKGSQSIRTEKIVERLMLEPEHARDLLVRQETNWRRR